MLRKSALHALPSRKEKLYQEKKLEIPKHIPCTEVFYQPSKLLSVIYFILLKVIDVRHNLTRRLIAAKVQINLHGMTLTLAVR